MFRLQYANRRVTEGGVYAMRVVLNDKPLAWSRVDDWWSFTTWLRGPVQETSPLPQIRAHDHVTDWPRYFLPHVQAVLPVAPLYFGPQAQPLPPIIKPARACGDWKLLYESNFWGAVWPLRMMSSQSDGRVKMWRKKARAGELPPIVLLHLSLLQGYVIMDGHDRLMAATLEGVRPEFLVAANLRMPRPSDLSKQPEFRAMLAEQYQRADVAKFSQATMDAFNQQLIEAWGPGRPSMVTRFYPMSLVEWRDQVIAAGRGEDVGDLIYGLRDLGP